MVKKQKSKEIRIIVLLIVILIIGIVSGIAVSSGRHIYTLPNKGAVSLAQVQATVFTLTIALGAMFKTKDFIGVFSTEEGEE